MESIIDIKDCLVQNERIHYYKNIINDSQKIIDIIEDNNSIENDVVTKWSWSSTLGHDLTQEPNTYPTYEFSEEKTIKNINSDNKEINYVKNKLYDLILKSSEHYSNTHNVSINNLKDLLISKCYPGKHTGPHVDSHGLKDSAKFSVVVFLNDNFEGGEMLFRKQKVLIKPLSGSILIYPSTEPFYHQPNLIRSGIKYVVTGYWF
jgi:hypothetical protein